MKPINLNVTWRAVWYSRYLRGVELSWNTNARIERVYRHFRTGQLRVYASSSLDGDSISVNGEAAVTVWARGRFGKLYIGDPL